MTTARVDGLKLPYKIELHRGKEAYDITVTRADVNGTVGERVFDFPKKSQVQLPDLKALFKEIDDNQKAIDKIKENYAGTRSGRGNRIRQDRENDQARAQGVHLLLPGRQRNLHAGKERRQAAERRRTKERKRKTQKEIQDLQKHEAKKEAKEEKAKEEGKEKKKTRMWVSRFSCGPASS